MANIETEYAIGDVVYTADQYNYKKEIIDAIKIEGLKNKVLYGIKSTGGGMWAMLYRGSGYNWYKPSEVFTEELKAEKYHESLKAKEEAKQAVKKDQDRKKRLDEIKREQEALEAGQEYDPYSDDKDF